MSAFMSIVGGVAIGVGGSIGAWLILFRIIRPRLEVAAHISRVPPPDDYPTAHVYRIKVRNLRKRRQAIDISVSCRVAFQGIMADRPTNNLYYDLEVESDLPLIRPGGSHIFWVSIVSNPELPTRLPPDLQAKFNDGTIRLEELLILPSAQLRFFVRCVDGFSGAPLLAEQQYVSGAVKIGQYARDTCRMALGDAAPSEAGELFEERQHRPTTDQSTN